MVQPIRHGPRLDPLPDVVLLNEGDLRKEEERNGTASMRTGVRTRT